MPALPVIEQITVPDGIDNALARDPNGDLVEIQRFWEPLE
jgi:hypothetical protein